MSEKQTLAEKITKDGSGGLKRQIKLRDVIMTCVGGTLGTGIFLSSGYVLSVAGPGGCMLAYLVGCLTLWMTMSMEGEICTAIPIPGGVQAWASEYINPPMGFTVGWQNWLGGALTITAQITASAIIAHNLIPAVSEPIWCVIFTIILFALNYLAPGDFGKTAFWFSTLKMLLVVGFVMVGFGLIFGWIGDTAYGLANYTKQGGLFPTGWVGIASGLLTANYAFGGSSMFIESSGEIEDAKAIPKAVNMSTFTLAGTYLLVMFVLCAVLPWQMADLDGSPIAYAFELAGIKSGALIVNVIVLTSALSSGNYFVFASSRRLWSLAKFGQAPKIMAKTDKRGVPLASLLVCMGFAAFGIITSFVAASTVYLWMTVLIASSNYIIGLCECVCYIHFRRDYVAHGGSVKDLHYAAPFFPLIPVVIMLINVVVLVVSLVDQSQMASILISFASCILMYVGFSIYSKKKGGLQAMLIEEDDE